MGEIFGDDPVSSLIGASYQAAHQIAEQSYASVAASFDGFGQALHAMADGCHCNTVDTAHPPSCCHVHGEG
jgi:hypothetical protein